MAAGRKAAREEAGEEADEGDEGEEAADDGGDVAGVEHVVDLSGEPESWWGSVCTAVEEGAAHWTHLWPADFVENGQMWFDQIRTTGSVREPWPELASTPTAMTDIAEVAAVALRGSRRVPGIQRGKETQDG